MAKLFRFGHAVILALLCIYFWGCVSANLVQTMLTDIDRIKQDNAELRRDVNALAEEVESLKVQVNETVPEDVTAEPAEVSADDFPGFIAGIITDDHPSAAPVATPPARPGMLSGEELYANAQALYSQSRFREAYQTFSQAVLLDTDEEFQARCYYWMGECMFAQAAYQRALDHFGRVYVNYGTSSKASDALLKIGFTYYELKNYNGAGQALDEFLRSFPDHRAAPLAKERLDRMRYMESGSAGDLDN